MTRLYVIVLLAMTALITPAWAQSRKENWKHCRDTNPEIQVVGCTAVIQSGNDKPRNLATAYDNRGNAHFAKGEYDAAIADYNQAIRLAPVFARSLIFLSHRGIAYVNNGEYDNAIEDYNAAIRLRPYTAEAFSDRGIAYGAKGENDAAIADYNQAIRLRPDFAYAFGNRGVAYVNKGEYERGIEDYNWAIHLKPDYYAFFQARCIARAIIGQFDQALSDCNHALSMSPNDTGALGARGFTYLKMGKYDVAIADYDAALGNWNKLNPIKMWPATWLYGRSLAKEKVGDSAGATADIAAAKEMEPKVVTWPGWSGGAGSPQTQ